MTWNARVDNQAAVLLAAGNILNTRTLLGVTGTLDPSKRIKSGSAVGDNAKYDLMVAGYGCPVGIAIVGWGTHTDEAGVWWFDTTSTVLIPTEVPAAERYLTYVTWLGDGSGTATSGKVAIVRACDENGDDNPAGTYRRVVDSVDLQAVAYNIHNVTLTRPIGPIATGDILTMWLVGTGAVGIGLGAAAAGTHHWKAGAFSTDPFLANGLTLANGNPLLRGYITTGCKRMAISVPTNGTATRIPSFRNTPYYIILSDMMAEDGQSLAVDIKSIQTANDGTLKATLQTCRTLVQDMGETNQITFAGNSLALAAGEEGDIFTHLILHDPTAKKTDLLYCNRETGQAGGTNADDVTLINHAVKNGSARALRYASGAIDEVKHYSQIAITSSGGTPTLGAVVIARRPWIGGVSSWAASKASATTAVLRNHVAAKLHDKTLELFTNQPWVETMGLSGGRFGIDTAGDSSFRKRFGIQYAADMTGSIGTSTIGLHDMCELRSATIFLEACIINDLIYGSSPDTGTSIPTSYRTTILAATMRTLAEIVQLAQRNDNEVVIFDIPPRLESGGTTRANHWQARKEINSAIAGLCSATGAIFVQTSEAITKPSTLGTADEALADAPIGQDVAHLAAAGDELVAAMTADAYDNGAANVQWQLGWQ